MFQTLTVSLMTQDTIPLQTPLHEAFEHITIQPGPQLITMGSGCPQVWAKMEL
jgi:hypothetical protein